MRVCIVKKLGSKILQLLSSCDHSLLLIVLACLFVQVPMSVSVFTALGVVGYGSVSEFRGRVPSWSRSRDFRSLSAPLLLPLHPTWGSNSCAG